MNRTTSPFKIFLLLLPGIGYILLFMTTVLYMSISRSFGSFFSEGGSTLSLQYWKETLSNALTWRSFLYSFRQGFMSAIFSVLLAYPIALKLRRPSFAATMYTGILRIPLLVPGLVAAFLFINIIAYHGIINQLLQFLGLISEPLRMQGDSYGIGIIVLQTWKNMPFALLLLASSMRDIPSEVIESARDFGANKFSLLWHIILPLTLPTMRAALIIIFIGALGDFSFNSVAGPRSFQSLSQYMVILTQQFFEEENAAVITILLMAASLLGALLLHLITKMFETRRKITI